MGTAAVPAGESVPLFGSLERSIRMAGFFGTAIAHAGSLSTKPVDLAIDSMATLATVQRNYASREVYPICLF